jgi:hypothetical protein
MACLRIRRNSLARLVKNDRYDTSGLDLVGRVAILCLGPAAFLILIAANGLMLPPAPP